MKLKVLQENLLKTLTVTSRFVSSKAQLPVLSNVLLKVQKGKLFVSATNLEISITKSLGAKVEKEGEITVPSNVLLDIVKNLPVGTVSIIADKEQLSLKSENSSSKVMAMNASDFPEVPDKVSKKSQKLPTEPFIDALNKVLFAVSVDEARPTLTGVLFLFKGNKANLVSTDGFRLSKKTFKVKKSKNNQFILPKNILTEIAKIAPEEVTFEFQEDDNQVIFATENSIMSSRTIDGQFPDFEKIIPKESKINLNLDKEELLRSVKLASVFARDSANVVKMSVGKEGLSLSAESSKSGSQKANVDAKVNGVSSKKDKLEIAFNFRFLEEFLNSVDGDDVQIELSDENSPGVFTDPKDKNYLHLIMPVRMKD